MVPLFSKVTNKDVVIKEYLEHPFGAEQLQVCALLAPYKQASGLK